LEAAVEVLEQLVAAVEERQWQRLVTAALRRRWRRRGEENQLITL
jgi:hypothetical protein